MRKPAIEAALFVALLGACLFGPAERLDWPMAWACLALFAIVTAAGFVLATPDLLRERATPGPGVDRGDVLLATAGFLGLYPGTLVVAGLDAGRALLEPAIPMAFQVLALGVFVLGYAFASWAVRANPFFATFVRIQSDRGHRLVDDGPYAWVRHPGYAGALLAHAALPVTLGSLWALLPALAGIVLFVLRTAREDRFLAQGLPGYAEYQRRVPWRLVPGVW